MQRKILEGLKIRETTLGALSAPRRRVGLSAAETLERSVPGLIRTVSQKGRAGRRIAADHKIT